jgi:hypothetical protein
MYPLKIENKDDKFSISSQQSKNSGKQELRGLGENCQQK